MFREIIHSVVWGARHRLGRYRPTELEFVEKRVSPGDVCIDVGAHAGSWTLPLGRLVGPQGAVYAFEALPYYARVLQYTLDLLGTPNIHLINAAVNDNSSAVSMVWADEAGKRLTGRTHIAATATPSTTSVTVPGITIDSVCAADDRRVSFVKIDIEGAELAALNGAASTIKKSRPMVLIEVVDLHLQRYNTSAAMVFDFFTALSYRPYVLANGSVVLTSLESSRHHNDVFFLPD